MYIKGSNERFCKLGMQLLPRQFHLGADIENTLPSKGIPEEAYSFLTQLTSYPSFLMVGTIEPRKRHDQVLESFSLLWELGVNVNLVIVGKQGWGCETLVERLRSHSEKGKRLFWLVNISDEYLKMIYESCTCLIAASEAEGFGLPLIEAAQHKLPIIARDIPVFREVSGNHAFYFTGLDAEDLAKAIQEWLTLHTQGQNPSSGGISWLTWRQSAQQLLAAILPESKLAENCG